MGFGDTLVVATSNVAVEAPIDACGRVVAQVQVAKV